VKATYENYEFADKLKGFGNTLLGKFGLSLDNFQMQKDPSTGVRVSPHCFISAHAIFEQ
jgi:hypothetical protein